MIVDPSLFFFTCFVIRFLSLSFWVLDIWVSKPKTMPIGCDDKGAWLEMKKSSDNNWTRMWLQIKKSNSREREQKGK